MTTARTAAAQTSALYRGVVKHARRQPFVHRFSYRVFSVLLDIDRVDEIDAETTLFSRNRFNIFSFYDRDHGYRDGSSIRNWVEQQLRRNGIDFRPKKILLFCFPRIFGYAFNPISVYFCTDQNNTTRAVLYEVHNTFGEDHTYVLPWHSEENERRAVHAADKSFYVSPFIGMNAKYRFSISEPDKQFAFNIREDTPDGVLLLASYQAERSSMTSRSLLAALLAVPFSTFKVTFGIHWHALRLWLKGAEHQPRFPKDVSVRSTR